MPRPGPRPYECVRRAWHSDRHQPIRGSLIKEIFRVANEIHSWSTKQNKEWQEKLPTVVLKAEEIMYSKANSEAEYMDLKTLWDRTNDAINTIIRREEGSESGQFLQPCIEAALNLGCTPRRASRSQRNCHPRCYLSSSTAEADHAAAANCPNLVPHQSCLGGSDPRSPLAQKNVTAAMKLASVPKGVPPTKYERLVGICNYAATNSYSAYPLVFGNVPPMLCYEDSAVRNTRSRDVNAIPDHSKIGCDLSLRLGPLSAAAPTPSSIGNKQTRDVEKDVSPRGGKLCDRPALETGFSLFPGGNTLGSFENVDAEARMRKRKAGFDQPAAVEDQEFLFAAQASV